MVKIFAKYKEEIEAYCAENDLSAEKIFHSARAYDNKSVIIQHFDPEKGKNGLLDETPAAITLAIFLENGKLRFEQTEHTHKYLGVEDKIARRVA